MTELRPARAVAAFDSATAMLRATANALQGLDFGDLGRSGPEVLPVRYSHLLPRRLRQTAFTVAGGAEGIPRHRVGDVDMDAIASWVVGHYPRRRYPGVVVGSSNGAAVHLCAAAGLPFLPQTLLVPVRWAGSDPDDPVAALQFGREVAPPLLARNPGVVLHHMHDGNQDRLMVDLMTYFRLKWAELPPAYEEFLSECLEPGAPIVILDDESMWPTTTVADRHVFQTGARGGMSPDEYFAQYRAPSPDGQSPEAEWGFEPGLAVSLAARLPSHPVHRIRIPEPQALSAPVADAMREAIRAAGGDGDRLLVESFVMLDPLQSFRSGSVPFWTFFGVESALDAVRRYLAGVSEPYRDVDVLVFPNGVAGRGAVPPADWRSLEACVSGRVRLQKGIERHWPAHFQTLGRYGRALRSLPDGVSSEGSAAMDVDSALAILTKADSGSHA